MAGEIHTQDLLATTGLTLYAVVRTSADRVANGTSLETYNASHWTSYAIALTDRGAGYYDATFPALAAGVYWVEVRQQAAGSPAITDLIFDSAEKLFWNGTSEIVPTGAQVFGTTGAIQYTYTVYDVDTVTPLPGTAVYVSSDLAGATRSEIQIADSLGRTVWQLDAGTVYFWRQHGRRTFVDPDVEVVS